MPFTATIVFSITVLVLWLVSLSFLLIRINNRLKKLLGGKKADNLEDVIIRLHSDVGKLQDAQQISYEGLALLDARIKKSIQHVGTIRFNPFPGTSGSTQSFATALIDGEGDGVIISSIYSREHMSVFAKPIKNYASTYDLSVEERRALETALDTKPTSQS